MKIINNIKLIFLITLILSIFTINTAFSKNLIIQGNNFIDDEVIYSIIGENNFDNNEIYINNILKVLYKTGNFKNIEIKETSDNIIIKIEENYRINKIQFQGNKRFKKDLILEQFKDSDYFEFYNEVRIDKFINDLKDLYLSYGYNQIEIKYEIKKVNDENNSINLNFSFIEGKISKINKIFFIGNKFFTKRDFLSEIKSNENNYLYFFRNENYKEFQIKNDLIKIKDFYQKNGFRDITINYKSEYIESRNRFNVYFYIEEGQRYEFGDLDLNTESLSMSDLKRENLKLVLDTSKKKILKNNIYNIETIDEIKQKLSSSLYKKGSVFFNIRVLDKIEDNKVHILYKIELIEPKYVNQINIYGNTRTVDKVIRREIKFTEGDAINDDLIASSLRNIENLRMFKSVQINEINTSDDKLDVDINVEEQSTGEFQVGLGFGTINGATFVTGLKEKNIAGLGREINLTINTSSNNTRYNFGIVEPYFLKDKLDFIFNIGYQEDDFSKTKSYNLNAFNTNTGFRYDLTDDITHRVTIEYQLKDYRITNTQTVATSVQKLGGNNAYILLNNGLIYNKLNSFMRPSEGIYLEYKNTISPTINSKNGYMINSIIHQKYFKKDVNIFSIKTKLGNIFSFEDKEINNDNKFSLGGKWLRGFDSFGAGPRNSRNSYIGGKNIIVSKFDLVRPINKNSDNPIDLNLFTDVGTVFGNKSSPTSAKESIRSSYGFGVKFYSPIGPIGISWAFPINSESYDIERMFLFSIGNLN